MRGHGMRVAVAVAAVGLILATRLSGVRCKPDVIQVCGPELADILQKACSGGYHTYENLANGTRKKRGIYQECCRQPCSYSEILQYCSDTSSLKETNSASVADPPKSQRDRKCRNVAADAAANPKNEAVTDRVDEQQQQQQQQDSCGDANDLDPPPLQPSPTSRLGGDATDGTPPHEEARENMTTTTTTPTPPAAGLHSKKPYFVGKVPALVLNISKKFSFGS